MTLPLVPQRIAVQDGNHLKNVRLIDIAAVVGIPPEELAAILHRLGVDGAQAVDELRIKFSKCARLNVRNVTDNDVIGNTNSERSSERHRCPGDEIGDEGYAAALATQLGDEANVRALRVLVANYPRRLLDDALQRTLTIPEENIRKSRGACFTAITRNLARQNQEGKPETTGPYA